VELRGNIYTSWNDFSNVKRCPVLMLSFLSDVYGLCDPSGKNALALCRSPLLETSWWHGSLELRGRWERICCVLLNLMHDGFLWMCISSDGDWQRARVFYQIDQRGHSHLKGRTTWEHIWKEGQKTTNSDEGSYQLSNAYDRFLDTASSRRVKNRKNWVPSFSDEGLW